MQELDRWALSPSLFHLDSEPLEHEFRLEPEFLLKSPLQEHDNPELSLLSSNLDDYLLVPVQTNHTEEVCCLIPSTFGIARYVNPKQFQRILKLRQKRLQRGWTRIDRHKSTARRLHAMRRKRLSNGRFAFKPTNGRQSH